MAGLVHVDTHELSDSAKRIIKTLQEDYPKDAQKLMRTAGNSYKRYLSKAYDQNVGTVTGNLKRGFVRGRPYLYATDDAYQVRVKNVAPHSPLLEYGHRIVTHKGVDTGKKVDGKHLIPVAQKQFDENFTKMCERFVDTIIKKGFSG